MKTVFIFLFALTVTAFSAGPIGNYQNTPPYVPGGATTTLTAGTQLTVCTGNCQLSTDSHRAQLSVVTSYLNTLHGDTSGGFFDTAGTGFTATVRDSISWSKTGYNVCATFVSGATGTSNGTGFTFGAWPTVIRPAGVKIFSVPAITNASVAKDGKISLATTGVPTLSWTDTAGVQSATFTASGTKAIAAGTTVCYSTR